VISHLLIVGAGGAIGSIARYGCQKWLGDLQPHTFPWGTFVVNIIGCLLIGIIGALAIKNTAAITQDWKLFLITGLCGGFTTFSAFSIEGINLLNQQRLFLFFAYVAGSVVLGLLATFVGIKLFS
jgi:fluoride exporter